MKTNYDDVLHLFDAYSKKRMKELSVEEKEKAVNVLTPLFLSKGVVKREYDDDFYRQQFHLLKSCEGVWLNDDSSNDLIFIQRSPAGTALCRAHCSGFEHTTSGGKETLSSKMKNERAVNNSIRWLIREGKTLSPLSIEDKVKVTGGSNTPSIFLPSRAKVLYDRYVPEEGVVFDYAFGWGSRALGALASNKVKRYIGVDPNTQTFDDVYGMLRKLCATNEIHNKCELNCVGSENFVLQKNSVDFVFSSPPYFNLEIYSNEETQSVAKFPKYELWLEHFVRPTIRNIAQGLKVGGRLGINVKDFKKIKLESDWVRIAVEEGLEFETKILMKTVGRPGDGVEKRKPGEPIFILKKNI
jgi:hypothetical protein